LLQNAWGVTFTPAGSPFWIADNATGCSTLYDGDGTKVTLQVSIPLPGNIVPPTACMPTTAQTTLTPAAPTGVVWNPTTNPATAFLVPGTNLPASFIFVTEDGTISAWTGGLAPPTQNNAVQAVDNSQVPNAASGAVYKAAVMSVNVNGVFLYVTSAPAPSRSMTTLTSWWQPMAVLSIRTSRPASLRSGSAISMAIYVGDAQNRMRPYSAALGTGPFY
jgi:hypothetical protein